MTAAVAAPGDVAARYERLRRAPLGEAVEPADRVGLTLLLRRGLSAWAQAIEPTPARSPQPAASEIPFPPDRRLELARLLAGMALAHTPATSAPP